MKINQIINNNRRIVIFKKFIIMKIKKTKKIIFFYQKKISKKKNIIITKIKIIRYINILIQTTIIKTITIQNNFSLKNFKIISSIRQRNKFEFIFIVDAQ